MRQLPLRYCGGDIEPLQVGAFVVGCVASDDDDKRRWQHGLVQQALKFRGKQN
jgi:hypothetical protein